MSGRDFWSRRRAAVAQEARAVETAETLVAEREAEAARAEISDDELLAEAKLPAPEELDSPEAVREFLASALPQRLKTRALRRLWRLNPVLANLDGLVDYGGDFTDSATVVENMQTAYQVGKGMLSHIEELARQAEAKTEVAEVEADPEEIEEEVPLDAADTDETVVDLVADAAAAEVEVDPSPLSRRRMTFTFEEQRAG